MGEALVTVLIYLPPMIRWRVDRCFTAMRIGTHRVSRYCRCGVSNHCAGAAGTLLSWVLGQFGNDAVVYGVAAGAVSGLIGVYTAIYIVELEQSSMRSGRVS
jgi:hypothetical protein